MNEQNQDQTFTRSTVKKPSKLLIALIAILAILTILGGGYSYYSLTQNRHQQSVISQKDALIRNLNSQLSTLQSTANSQKEAGNVIPIRELGVSITVPDEIKDLTYSYSSGKQTGSNAEGYPSGATVKSVSFSTVALTDKDKGCSSFGDAPPLGGISRYEGKDKLANDQSLVKQFSTFYILYSSPQASCSSTTPAPGLNPNLKSLSALKQSLSSVKEL